MAEVWIRRKRWRVIEERPGMGVTCLRVFERETGQTRDFLTPCDAAVTDRRRRVRRVPVRQALARLAGHLSRASFAFTPASLAGNHLDIFPFQLEPALALLAGRRRLLIADDVGLGKTVQAGLLLRTAVESGPEARALVIAPASLLHQWAGELASRFALPVLRADTLTLARLRASSAYLANPWMRPGVWLTSPDFLKQPHICDGLPAQPWDLIVIDEAHQLAGGSQRHDAINRLATQAASLALLTATPHDGDDSRFRRLLSIGSRGDGLTTFRRTRRADTNRRRVRWLAVRLTAADSRTLNAIDAFERAARPAGAGSLADGLPLICAVFRRRALSSPEAFGASVARRLAILDCADLPPQDTWQQPGLFDSDVFSGDEAAALAADSGLPAGRERAWLLRLQHLSAGHVIGGRSRGLSTLLRRAPDPAVIFTQYRDSLPAIVRALPAHRRAVVMHGGLPPAEQQRALGEFLAGRADTLVATDVASQGLNLQTASRWAISFDVPWTPLRLEQRIGRVDRFGQPHRVHGTILISRHPHDRESRGRFETRAHQSAHAPLVSCRRWTNAAWRVAVWNEAQRRLSTHWRHPSDGGACEAIVSPAFTRRWLGRTTRGIACYEIPFVTPAGDILERRVVATDSDAPETALVRYATRRARILTRRARLRAALRERAQPVTGPVQPGLFDRRAPIDAIQPADTTPVGAGLPRLLVRFVARAEPKE